LTAPVFARISGLGYTLLPVATPFRAARMEAEAPAFRVVVGEDEGERQAFVKLGGRELAFSLSPDTEELSEVVELSAGPELDHLRIDTTVFTVRWPATLVLASPGPDAPTPFDLHGPDGALVFVQGPYPAAQVPPPEALRGPEQQHLRSGATAGRRWAEFGYTHEGRRWVQRQYVVPFGRSGVLLVSSQALEAHAALIAAAADEVASSLAPYRAAAPG
jgi:hypothetical protein